MLRVILTSFEDSGNHPGRHFSIARWQPQWTRYPQVAEGQIAPNDDRGAIRGIQPADFRVRYEAVLQQHRDLLLSWFRFMLDLPGADYGSAPQRWYLHKYPQEPNGDLVLCCWCNAERQKPYPTLYCHRILVGYWLEREFGDEVQVVYADGAEKPVWERVT